MVLNNLGLVHFVAHRLPDGYHHLETYEEIVSIGMAGLIKACQRFDERGRFSSYATPLIKGEIWHHFRKFYFGRSNKQSRSLQWTCLDALPNLNSSMAIAYQNPSHSDLEGYDKICSIMNECELSQFDQDLICLRVFEELKWKEIAALKNKNAITLVRRYKKALLKIKQWYISKETL